MGLKTNYIILYNKLQDKSIYFLFVKTVYAATEIGDDATRENGESKLCLYRGIWISLEPKTRFPALSVVISPPISREFEWPIFRNFYLVNLEKTELLGEMVWNLVGFTARVAWKMKSFDYWNLTLLPAETLLKHNLRSTRRRILTCILLLVSSHSWYCVHFQNLLWGSWDIRNVELLENKGEK